MSGRPLHDLAAEAAESLCALLFYDTPSREGTRLPARLPTSETAAVVRGLRRLAEEGTEPDRALLVDAIEAAGDDAPHELISSLAVIPKSRTQLGSYLAAIREWDALERLKIVRADLDRAIDSEDGTEGLIVLNRALEGDGHGRAEGIKPVMSRVFCEMEQPPPAMPTGIAELDYLLDDGLRGGEVMVIAARPSIGKSVMALQLVMEVASRGEAVAVWSLEMSHEQWLRRLVASVALVPLRSIRSGRLGEEEMARAARNIGPWYNAPIHFADTSDTTPDGFALEAARAVRGQAVKLLVIDYLQLMQPPPNGWSRENEVATMSRRLKMTALRLGVPIVLLAQLSRSAENRIPTLSTLRESGAIEQDADIVLLLHRDRDEDTQKLKPNALGIVAKNRDGETGSFPLWLDGSHMRVEAPAPPRLVG